MSLGFKAILPTVSPMSVKGNLVWCHALNCQALVAALIRGLNARPPQVINLTTAIYHNF